MQTTDPRLAEALDLIAGRADVSTLWLYGSRARGDSGPHSDFDLAVTFQQRAVSPIDAVARVEQLRGELQQVMGTETSLVDLDRAPVPLAASITAQGLLLLDRTPLQTGWLCQRIWSRWDDWCFHRSGRGVA